MRKYFLEYLAYLDSSLADENTDFERLLEIHKRKTEYFQHERLVHLIVMVFVGLCVIGCFLTISAVGTVTLIPLAILLLGLFIPYVAHYYFLENNTQKLYKYYDEICRRLENKKDN